MLEDGRLFCMGTNRKWQCTELEAITESTEATVCVDPKYLDISDEERRWLRAGNFGEHDSAGSMDNLLNNIPVIPLQVREMVQKLQL